MGRFNRRPVYNNMSDVWEFGCIECGRLFTNEERNGYMFAKCECGAMAKWADAPKPPPCHGLSDGPGSSSNQVCFERPDLKKEAKRTMRIMEESGAFKKNPQLKKVAEYKYNKIMGRNYKKVDYDKGGHRLD